MNLAGVDLNLLVVFDALLVERNTTRAGNRIGMSQPAVSKALNRLRHLCKDELFIRSSDGMQPTPRALELSQPVQAALQQLSNALEPGQFDPATEDRTFRIVTNDLITRLMMPAVMARLDKEAPGIDLHLLPDSLRMFDQLDKNEADLALINRTSIPESYESQLLIEASESVVMMRDGHALCDGELTLERLLDARQVIVTTQGAEPSPMDEFFQNLVQERHIGIRINQIIAGPAIVAATDLIMIVPRRLAAYQASFQNVSYRPLPAEFPRVELNASMLWHKRLTDNPAHVWLRQIFEEIAAERPQYSRREYSE